MWRYLGALTLATGCAPSTQQACEDYLLAVQTCFDEADVTYDATVYEDTCERYDGQSDAASTDAFLCLADTWDAWDCTSEEEMTVDCETE